jgi:hypothetical protein
MAAQMRLRVNIFDAARVLDIKKGTIVTPGEMLIVMKSGVIFKK